MLVFLNIAVEFIDLGFKADLGLFDLAFDAVDDLLFLFDTDLVLFLLLGKTLGQEVVAVS